MLDPFGDGIGAVGVEAMVAHADAPADRDPVKDKRDGQGTPLEEKGRGEGTDMKNSEKGGGDPINFFIAVDGGSPRSLCDHK